MRITRHRSIFAAIGPAQIGPMRRDDPHDGSGSGNDGGGGDSGNSGSGDDGGKPASGDGDDGKKPKIDGDLDPDRAARSIAAAREAEKKAKERAQAAEQAQKDTLDKVAVALGLKPDPKADPTELVKQAAAERDQAKQHAQQQAVELAVYRTAGKAGGDPDALLDSRTFLSSLDDLDPEDKDFPDKVKEAIQKAIKQNPKLAAAGDGDEGDGGGDGKTGAAGKSSTGSQGPARQGADHNGRGSGGKQRPTSLSAAIAARRNQ